MLAWSAICRQGWQASGSRHVSVCIMEPKVSTSMVLQSHHVVVCATSEVAWIAAQSFIWAHRQCCPHLCSNASSGSQLCSAQAGGSFKLQCLSLQ